MAARPMIGQRLFQHLPWLALQWVVSGAFIYLFLFLLCK